MNTVTDVSGLIDEVFGELECVMDRPGCGGDRAAYVIVHGCVEGIICKSHLDRWLRVFATFTGPTMCTECQRTFPSGRAFAKVYPL